MIREAYTLIAQIVARAQREGSFRTEIDAELAAMVFYGVIEQVLTGWIFGLLPADEEHFERAKRSCLETVCGGLEAGRSAGRRGRASSGAEAYTLMVPMNQDWVKRLVWSGLLAASGALASIARAAPGGRRLAADLRRGAAGMTALRSSWQRGDREERTAEPQRRKRRTLRRRARVRCSARFPGEAPTADLGDAGTGGSRGGTPARPPEEPSQVTGADPGAGGDRGAARAAMASCRRRRRPHEEPVVVAPEPVVADTGDESDGSFRSSPRGGPLHRRPTRRRSRATATGRRRRLVRRGARRQFVLVGTPEVLLGAAFAGGLLLAALIRRRRS